MEIRLVGPLDVCIAGSRVDTGTPRQRAVLAVLAVDAGSVVSVDSLIDRVWGQAPPLRVREALQVYVARIRRRLRQAADDQAEHLLLRRSPGYLLDVDPACVDVHRFRLLVDRARASRQSEESRAACLRQALDLWSGTPLADVPGDWAARSRSRWERYHADAVLSWADAELAVGHPDRVLGCLTDLADQNPLAEAVAAALMRALGAAGHRTDALDRYTTIRNQLVEQLGVDPEPELQELHRAILRGDVRPSPTVRPMTASAASVVPRQLPIDVRGFTGRDVELKDLETVANAANGPRVVAITGMAGVGKTALAVHWAHRSAIRFPDGQLYVNLRGFGPSHDSVDPHDVLRGFLDAFGVAARRIPDQPQARVGLYRSLLANRRVLVTVDNAGDAEQVRPLLPGSLGCMTVVTSRDQLCGLVIAEAAHSIRVDVLSDEDARQLIASRTGFHRVAAEPQATADIIARCARLPLALALVAARAVSQPELNLADIADRLASASHRLDTLSTANVQTDVLTL